MAVSTALHRVRPNSVAVFNNIHSFACTDDAAAAEEEKEESEEEAEVDMSGGDMFGGDDY